MINNCQKIVKYNYIIFSEYLKSSIAISLAIKMVSREKVKTNPTIHNSSYTHGIANN